MCQTLQLMVVPILEISISGKHQFHVILSSSFRIFWECHIEGVDEMLKVLLWYKAPHANNILSRFQSETLKIRHIRVEMCLWSPVENQVTVGAVIFPNENVLYHA